MNTKMIYACIIAISVVSLANFTKASSEKGAETMALKGGSRGDILFPHGKHQGVTVDCLPCHGLFPKKSESIGTMQTEGKLKKREVMNMCKGCHKELKNEGGKAGPTSCNGCHKK